MRQVDSQKARGVEPPRRVPISFAAIFAALALVASGCTIGQTRFALGFAVAADAATTQTALNSGNAREANPVLQTAPVPIMLVLSGVVALVAEKDVRDGRVAKAKTLYRIASVVHGLAAAWNGYQLGRSSGANESGAGAVQPALLKRIPGGPAPPGRGTDLRFGF